MPKVKEEIRPDEDGKFKAADMFGVSDERAEDIFKMFLHAKIDTNTWTGVWSAVVTQLKSEEEAAYAGYVFGRLYSKIDEEESEMPEMPDFLKEILRHASHVGHGH